MIVAANTKRHPISSLPFKYSCKKNTPQIAAKTDSKLKIRDATAGSAFF